VLKGTRHTDASRARMSKSLRTLHALQMDELRPVVELGNAVTVRQYAEHVGCSRATARERLNRLVANGYAIRFREPGCGLGGANSYAQRPQT